MNHWNVISMDFRWFLLLILHFITELKWIIYFSNHVATLKEF